jgi:hypothetical protein
VPFGRSLARPVVTRMGSRRGGWPGRRRRPPCLPGRDARIVLVDVIVPNLSGVTSLSVGYGPLSPVGGGGAIACAVVTGGAVECWGSGPVVNSTATPVPIAGLSSGVTAVSVGTSGACAITAGGGVTCWGSGEYVRPTDPVQVADSSAGATALSVGTEAACIVAAGGGVMCWGSNGSGQLGAPVPDRSDVPLQVPGLTDGFKSVVVGDTFACAVSAGGEVVCWGVSPFQDPASRAHRRARPRARLAKPRDLHGAWLRKCAWLRQP